MYFKATLGQEQSESLMNNSPEVSILIVSYNTCELTRKCLKNTLALSSGFSNEIIVVDNASTDQSSDMIKAEFPSVRLIDSQVNLGFASANNTAFEVSSGKYIVLLNTDAFLHPNAIQKALGHARATPDLGLGGGKLVSQDGSLQPSARLFPSLLNEFLQLSGLSYKFPKSKFFGRFNMTWKSPDEPSLVDWIPGAFAIIPRSVIEAIGFFDPRYYLYYEEVDLCMRMKNAGLKIWYWPDVVVTHIGGESAKTQKNHLIGKKSTQLELWRMRSQLLFFRKNYGTFSVHLINLFECIWHQLRKVKNHFNDGKKKESELYLQLLKQAWVETDGGRTSPPIPW